MAPRGALAGSLHAQLGEFALGYKIDLGNERFRFLSGLEFIREAGVNGGRMDMGAKWLKANHFSSAILVTNNYHVPRSLIELRQQARNATLSAYPVVNARLDGLRWLVNRDVLRVLFIEYSKFVAALGRNLFSAGGVPVIGPTLART